MQRSNFGVLVRLLILLVLSHALVACGASNATLAPARPAPLPTPSVVTDRTYADVVRAFVRLDVQAPERAGLRERLVEHLLEKADAAISADRYQTVVDRLAQITELYTSQELQDHAWPDGLLHISQYLITKGSPRGDEARVLTALLIEQLAHPEDAGRKAAYDKLVRWGFDARADMSGPLENFVGLVETWEEHARLFPTNDVMTTLVRLYVQRRNALVALFQSTDEQVPLSASVFQGVQRTAFDVSGVFLKQGDAASALTQLRALGPSGGIENQLGEKLQQAREDGTEGANARLDLSRVYLEGARPDVARALCSSGLRTFRDDARFPQCLARVATVENDYSGALAWYADAIALAPEERALYDEILEVLGGLIAQGTLGSDAESTHALTTRATEIMKERMRRWPSSEAPIAPEELYTAIAAAEMNAGNAKDAEAHFLESLKVRAVPPTLLQYCLLLERIGRPKEAVERYRKALELITDDSPEDNRKRAELWERLGDAQRESGARDESLRAYDKALALWNQVLPVVKLRRTGVAQLRRGVLLGRLSRAAEAKSAFQEAMDVAPNSRETYATILAYLVVSEPDADFGYEVFRSAQNQAGLPPEWKVYFALWLRMIVARDNQQLGTDVIDVLEEFGKGEDWSAKLSRFGAGKLTYEKLAEEATTLGERAEADFYEGARRLSAKDTAGANEMFNKVLATQMVSFYEYSMAQELVTLPAPAAAAPPQVSTQTPVH